MQTLGIDLAADPKRTAAVIIDWSVESAPCTLVEGGDDEALLEAMSQVDFVGIDAPIGWPTRFIEAVTDYSEGKRWPEGDRSIFRYRLTDEVVRSRLKSINPLSVSSDLIAVTAMRCALLLARWEASSGEQVDRSGAGKISEVYPAASLATWGYQHSGYKGTKNRETLMSLVRTVVAASGVDASALMNWNDHIFDALVASLTMRMKASGHTLSPDADQLDQARIEGWIHIPSSADLKRELS
jgi:predicted nuclease with RNAse H fold